jgi:TetR/AcrR family transcriptional regulator, cholesterol catabolism regulator
MDMETEEKESVILEHVRKIFMRYGIRSVTMDDISRELKISKKTLYKFVTDKQDLVVKVMNSECLSDQCMFTEIVGQSKNAIDELLNVTAHIGQKIQQFHPSIHYDLEKYYPEAWELFNKHKGTFVYECVVNNLRRGMKEGLYRDTLQPEIISKIYVTRIDMIFDPEIFPQPDFQFGEVYKEMMRYHIRGIASEKGIKYLLDKLKSENIKF